MHVEYAIGARKLREGHISLMHLGTTAAILRYNCSSVFQPPVRLRLALHGKKPTSHNAQVSRGYSVNHPKCVDPRIVLTMLTTGYSERMWRLEAVSARPTPACHGVNVPKNTRDDRDYCSCGTVAESLLGWRQFPYSLFAVTQHGPK